MLNVDLALLADAANLSDGGKLNILGEFNVLNTVAPPWALVGRSLVLRLVGNAGDEGTHTLGLRLLDPDRQLVWSSGDAQFEFAAAKIPGTVPRNAAIIELPPVMMRVEGPHELEILVDGQALESVELHCVLEGASAPGDAAG